MRSGRKADLERHPMAKSQQKIHLWRYVLLTKFFKKLFGGYLKAKWAKFEEKQRRRGRSRGTCLHRNYGFERKFCHWKTCLTIMYGPLLFVHFLCEFRPFFARPHWRFRVSSGVMIRRWTMIDAVLFSRFQCFCQNHAVREINICHQTICSCEERRSPIRYFFSQNRKFNIS